MIKGESLEICVCVLSRLVVCPALCNFMDGSPPGSSVHGIFQARILEWVAISFSRGSSWPRDRTCISYIGRQILSHWAARESLIFLYFLRILCCKIVGWQFCFSACVNFLMRNHFFSPIGKAPFFSAALIFLFTVRFLNFNYVVPWHGSLWGSST